jgi:hypothetical protein
MSRAAVAKDERVAITMADKSGACGRQAHTIWHNSECAWGESGEMTR